MEFHRVTRAALVDPKTPDEAVDQTIHILTITRKDDGDATPLQFVSAARLAHLLKLEAAAAALAALIEKAPREVVAPQEP
jgi:hypothetical protein